MFLCAITRRIALAPVETLGCFALLFALGAQDSAKPAAPQSNDRLQALIERTNGLKSFVAEYRGKDFDDHEIEVDLADSAPDRLKMRLLNKGKVAISVLDGGRVQVRGNTEEGGETFANGDLWPIPSVVVAKVMGNARALFPGVRMADPDEACEAYIGFGLTHPDEGKPRIDFGVGRKIGRSALLEWLPFLKGKTHVVTEDAETIVFEDDGNARVTLQKSTGFLESIRVSWNGHDMSLRLAKLSIDEPLEANEFFVPEPTAKAHDDSAAFGNALFWLEAGEMQAIILNGVVSSFDGHEAGWNDEAKSKTRRALETLHGEILDLRFAKWVEEARTKIDEYCLWIQSARAEADADKLAELDHQVDQYESGLHKQLDGARDSYLKLMPVSENVPKSQPWTDVRGIDRDACDAAFTDHVEAPTIGRFDEQIALARQGKLVAPDGGKSPSPEKR